MSVPVPEVVDLTGEEESTDEDEFNSVVESVLSDLSYEINSELERLLPANAAYTEEELSASYTLDEDTEAIFIGDLHGDLDVFLQVLSRIPCFDVPAQLVTIVSNYVAACLPRATPYGAQRRDFPQSPPLDDILWKVTGPTKYIVVFLGDVIDNRRPHTAVDAYPGGICTFSDAELQIMKCISRLCFSSPELGHTCRWVIGNHEMGNLFGTIACRLYAPLDYCMPPPGDHQFTEVRKTLVRMYMLHAKAVAVVNVNGVLCSHGGINNEFVDHFKSEGDGDGGGTLHTRTINEMYRTMIDDMIPNAHYAANPMLWPDWCRPAAQPVPGANAPEISWEKSKIGMSFIKPEATRMVVAHVPQQFPNCSMDPTNPPTLPTEDDTINEFSRGELCRIDLGMSGAFAPFGFTKRGFMKVNIMGDGGLVREFVTW